MATINITNTSIQYTGEAFQGNVTFDLNITDTEVKLDVAFKVNLAAQLNFNSIDYNSNELLDWCKKQLNALEEYQRANVFHRIFKYDCYDAYKEDDQFLTMLGRETFCYELVNILRVTEDEKAELFGLAVIYPSGQNTLTYTIEFSIPKNSLFNWAMEQLNQELQQEFLTIAGHKLDLYLSAELDMSSGHTNSIFQYTT